jgi:hypothetical protein
MIDLQLPPKPALIRAAEPWQIGLTADLKRRGFSGPVRRTIVAELERASAARPAIIKALTNDLAKYAGDTTLASMLLNPYIYGGSFPTRRDVSINAVDSNNTSHTHNLPSYVAGDLLVAFACVQPSSTATITSFGGWTQVYQTANGASAAKQGVFYKVAASEGTTISATVDVSSRLLSVIYSITTGTYSGTPEGTSVADPGASASPNPPSLTPTGGSARYLWLVACSQDNSNPATVLPTGFSSQFDAVLAGTNRPSMSTCQQALVASSLDPSAFTITTSSRWVAGTVAIRGT